LDGKDVRIGIIRTRWNSEHVGNLVTGCRKALKECNVKEENIFETEVPGSFELPLAARFLALTGTVDAIVTAGVLIKGEVSYFVVVMIFGIIIPIESVCAGYSRHLTSSLLSCFVSYLQCLSNDFFEFRSPFCFVFLVLFRIFIRLFISNTFPKRSRVR
jgi:hypothetical protein